MKTNISIKKRTSLKNHSRNTLLHERNGQMITLMGVTLALSVIIMGSLAAEISDIDVTISQERSNDLLAEFVHIKKAFGMALNYNLVDINTSNMLFEGDLYGTNQKSPNIANVVTQTSNSFRAIELRHDKIFTATHEALDYSYLSDEGHVYNVRVRLSLKDKTGMIVEPVVYSIVCKEPQYE